MKRKIRKTCRIYIIKDLSLKYKLLGCECITNFPWPSVHFSGYLIG
jgi:hypothetical protein